MKVFVQSRNDKQERYVVQGLVPFTELMDKAIFTLKQLKLADHGDSDSLDIKANSDYYQRRLDNVKLRKIQKFIINSILDESEGKTLATLFPSSMILATDVDSIATGDVVDIELGDIYVVDGQHRLMAMKKVYEELTAPSLFQNTDMEIVVDYLKSYKFNCTILLNYDLWEQGQVFANVNFTQKPVSRSLYYEIFGTEFIEEPRDWSRNYIYLAHQLTKFMNENESSPFLNKIKMLGNGEGYVSQAFFVEALTRHFKIGKIWGKSMTDRQSADLLLIYAKSELLSYYKAIEVEFSKYWGQKVDNKLNFICKTTGTGAFLRLLEDIHEEVVDENLESKLHEGPEGTVCQAYYDAVRPLLHVIAQKGNELFGSDSKYGGTGGKGLEVKLYEAMLNIVGLHKVLAKLSDFSRNHGKQLYRTIQHAKLINELASYGITINEGDILVAIKSSLLSEIIALGPECQVVSFQYITYDSRSVHSDDSQTYFGDGYCNVQVKDQVYNDKGEMSFPVKFSFEIKKENGKWSLDSTSWKFMVNTNKYYL